MTASPTALPKRFYKAASWAEGEDGWNVQLDGRTPVTPAKKKLSVPTEALAKAIAEEWERQESVIDLPNMTLTRLANVAIDRTPLTRDAQIAEVTKYAGTDLVCYLADGPTALRERQEEHFRPLRDWISREFGVTLETTEGLIPQAQPVTSLQAVASHAEKQDDFTLTGLTMGASLLGSAVLAIAVAEGELQAVDAFDMSRIEELWQIEQWGEDDEATAMAAAKRLEALALGRWFDGLRTGIGA